jgi:signal transduction histidine kinase
LPQGDSGGYYLALGILLSNALMMAAVASRIRRVRHEKEAAQDVLQFERQNYQERLEQELQERTAELQTALMDARQAREAQTRMVAYVGHDLRAPLATIVSYAHLLGQHGDAQVQRYQSTIESSANYQLELIDDLVEHARSEMGHATELLPVANYWHQWLDSLTRQAELLARQRGNQLRLETDPNLPPVLVFDAKRLRQVLLNLLGNAAKFTDNGCIGLKIQAGSLSDDPMTLAFAVSDTGSGIEAQDVAHIFEPFERRKSQREGSGLGLSISRQWVTAMGGEITVASTPGAGSCFAFQISLSVGAESDVLQPNVAFALPEPFGTGKTVLVVDDDEAFCNYLTEVLHSADFDVVLASSGAQALQMAQQQPFDALLTDQTLPDMSGWQLLRALHAQPSEALPAAILCSATPAHPPADWSENVQFARSLQKPVAPAKLLQVMREVYFL